MEKLWGLADKLTTRCIEFGIHVENPTAPVNRKAGLVLHSFDPGSEHDERLLQHIPQTGLVRISLTFISRHIPCLSSTLSRAKMKKGLFVTIYRRYQCHPMTLSTRIFFTNKTVLLFVKLFCTIMLKGKDSNQAILSSFPSWKCMRLGITPHTCLQVTLNMHLPAYDSRHSLACIQLTSFTCLQTTYVIHLPECLNSTHTMHLSGCAEVPRRKASRYRSGTR